MEIIAKISNGSKMDQVYIPKNRIGMSTGEYVVVTPLRKDFGKTLEFKPFFYNVTKIEPLKLDMIKIIIEILNDFSENIIITGSFIEKGFRFNDIDILLITDKKNDLGGVTKKIEEIFGVKLHLIPINKKTLSYGLTSDPLYVMMLSKCISKERIIFNFKRKIDYKILDFQLLKSKDMMENFNYLNGREKYYLTFNMACILLFIEGKKLSRRIVEDYIEKEFEIKVDDIKNNMLFESKFLKKYKYIYQNTFEKIMKGIK